MDISELRVIYSPHYEGTNNLIKRWFRLNFGLGLGLGLNGGLGLGLACHMAKTTEYLKYIDTVNYA